MQEPKRVTHPVSGPNPTQQSQFAETDINSMSGKYLRSRLAGNPDGRKPMFMDVPSQSFHEMMNKVVTIQSTFAGLPSKIRQRFMNNPTVLLSWLENPDNRREGVKLGLIHDPEMAYAIEQDALKRAPVKQETLFPATEAQKADPEAQPRKQAQKPE